MPIDVECVCGFAGKVFESSAGRVGPCPRCGAKLHVPPLPVVVEPAQESELAELAAAVRAVSNPYAASFRTYGYAAPVIQTVHVHRNPTNSLAISGMIVALVSLPVCWLPLFGLVLGAVAFLLSTSGGIVAVARQGHGAGYAIAGVLVGGMVCIINGLILGGIISATKGL